MADSFTLAKRGYTKSSALALLTGEWNLTTRQQELLDIHQYYVRKWETSWVRNTIRDGLLTHEGISYAVIYRSCTPASLRGTVEVKCSFRASGNGNFVLVQPTITVANTKLLEN